MIVMAVVALDGGISAFVIGIKTASIPYVPYYKYFAKDSG